MENLLLKSREHLKAANILHKSDPECYSSIPHCSYYACFQLIIYIMKMEISYEGKDSHNNLINSIQDEIYNRCGSDIALEFNNNISKLKKERSEADYKNRVFYKKDSEKNIKVANDLTIGLFEIFKDKIQVI